MTTGDPEEDEDLEEIQEWHVDCGYYLTSVHLSM